MTLRPDAARTHRTWPPPAPDRRGRAARAAGVRCGAGEAAWARGSGRSRRAHDSLGSRNRAGTGVRPNRHRPRAITIGRRAAVVISMAVVLLLTSIGLAPPLAAQGTVAVPVIVDVPEAQATAAITAAGLVVGARSRRTTPPSPPATSPARRLQAVSRWRPAQRSTTSSASGQRRRRCSRPRRRPPSRTKPPRPRSRSRPPGRRRPASRASTSATGTAHPTSARCADSGMEFVFSKASQGTWLQDETFQRNTAGSARGRPAAGRLPLLRLHEGGQAAGQALPGHGRRIPRASTACCRSSWTSRPSSRSGRPTRPRPGPACTPCSTSCTDRPAATR